MGCVEEIGSAFAAIAQLFFPQLEQLIIIFFVMFLESINTSGKLVRHV